MIKKKLSSVIDIISGGTPKTSVKEYWENGDIAWLSIDDFNNGSRYVYDSSKKITKAGLENSNTKILIKDDLIISARGTVGVLAQIGNPMAFNQSCFGLRAKKEFTENNFLYYYLKNYISNIKKRSQGSVFSTINLKSFDLMEIEIPELSIQRKIAEVLSVLDLKIELNNKINKELEVMAKTLYNYWFVQFDFPNADGKPYKSSGGEMVWNEELKREIPKGWEVKHISDLLSVVTGKQDANFATKNGKYNFFTCGEEILKCDTYEFEGKAVLVAGNGNFNIKLYEGKFNAYQRTYILIPNIEKHYTVIYMAVRDRITSLTKGSRGSIVKFITKGDLEGIQIPLPKDQNLDVFSQLNDITKLIELKLDENQKFIELRDWLLPMLMNGQVKVK